MLQQALRGGTARLRQRDYRARSAFRPRRVPHEAPGQGLGGLRQALSSAVPSRCSLISDATPIGSPSANERLLASEKGQVRFRWGDCS